MIKIIPSISVPNALEAIDFYKKVFGAKLDSHNPVDPMMAQSMNLPSNFDFSKSTIHSEISIDGVQFYIADDMGNSSKPNGRVEITILPTSLQMIETFYQKAVKEGSIVTVKLEKQFWGDYYCRFTDPFGVGWQMNYTPPKEDETITMKKPATKKSAKKSTKKPSKK